MLKFQPFLSLNEAIELSKEFDLDLQEKDILFLSSLGKFRAFNYISVAKYSSKGKPVYKIRGVKYLYEAAFPTGIRDLMKQIANIDESICTLSQQDCNGVVELSFQDKQNDEECTVYLYGKSKKILPSRIEFKHCRIRLPICWKDELDIDEMEYNKNEYDYITGMLESTFIETEAIVSKNNNAGLFLDNLQKSIASGINRSMIDFKINSIIKYNLLLTPYELESEDRYNDELMKIDQESNFDDVFFFRTDELTKYFREISHKKDVSFLENELTTLQSENNKLKARINQLQQNTEQNTDVLEQAQGERTSQPQRDLFTCLL